VTRHLPAALAVCAAAGAWWQLNQKLSRQHAARMAQASATHRVVTAAIRDQDVRAHKLLEDITKAGVTRRRGRTT
jgi:hypothetical protein